MARQESFGRSLLVSVDARGYGAADGRRQANFQEALVRLLDEAAERADLHRSSWRRQPAGDGELALLPPDAPEDLLIDDFVPALDRCVARHNADLTTPARLRLRLAVHHGVAFPGANGYVGAGVVVVSRLVDCGAARRIQDAADDIGLVLILSNRVYLDTVAQRHTHLDPARDLVRVPVQVKEYREDAWLHVPRYRAEGLRDLLDSHPAPDVGSTGPARPDVEERSDATAAPPVAAARPGEPNAWTRRYQAEVISEFNGPVKAEVIGIKKVDGRG
ncbi:hypothetical protein [Micromonospora sp. NPDC051141]|uniref:hypothetical protein n=1 Tax=Micromonospora sp. NPDC051141 TaxID=3364284 RepID=UPI00379DFD73